MNRSGALLAARNETGTPVETGGLALSGIEPPESSASLLARVPEDSGWRADAERRIRDLRWLAPDWDGPASPTVTHGARGAALLVVARLSEYDGRLRVPTVTPTPFGGVFIEWHSTQCTLAFTIDASGKVEISYDDIESGVEREEADPFRRELADEWLLLLARHRV